MLSIGADSLAESDEKQLRSLAEAEYAGRRARSNWLPARFLGEPGWDGLLCLYIGGGRGERVSQADFCMASGAPEPTALRWLAALEADGLAQTMRSPHDRQLQYVELTEVGRLAIEGWLRYRATFPI